MRSVSLPSRQAERGREKIQILSHSHVVVIAELVRHIAHKTSDLTSLAAAIRSADACGAAGGPGKADKDADRRGLSDRWGR